MNDGIKILIERMDSNPEEFFGELSHRWANIMQDIAKHGPEFLDEEDLFALNRKVKEIRRKELVAKIVDEISTATRLKEAQDRIDAQKEMLTMVSKSPTVKKGLSGAWWTEVWMDSNAFNNG
jgi:hypothetical protein